MASSQEKTSVMVTIAQEHRAALHEVLAKLKETGLEVETVLDRLGRVQGRITPGKIKALEQVKGVEGVRPEMTFRADAR